MTLIQKVQIFDPDIDLLVACFVPIRDRNLIWFNGYLLDPMQCCPKIGQVDIFFLGPANGANGHFPVYFNIKLTYLGLF